MALIELRLDHLFTDFPHFLDFPNFGIYLVVFALKFFIHGHGWSGER